MFFPSIVGAVNEGMRLPELQIPHPFGLCLLPPSSGWTTTLVGGKDMFHHGVWACLLDCTEPGQRSR
jgi:hypothetical protein